MMSQNKLFDGFIAAMLHDLGKIILNEHGRWDGNGGHEAMNTKNNPLLTTDDINFESILTKDVFNITRKHHDLLSEIETLDIDKAKLVLKEKIDTGKITLEEIALFMADKFQKGMYQIEKPSDTNIDRTMNYPKYFPYYGNNEQWDEYRSAPVVKRIANELSSKFSLKQILDIQSAFLRFPHTTYIPHISLAIHHRFTAVLFYFIYHKLKSLSSPLDLKEIEFEVIQITPEPLNLLYRMRDVKIFKEAIQQLREHLFKKIFLQKDQQGIWGITSNINPFEFFHKDSLVLMWDNSNEIIFALKEFVDNDFELHSLKVGLKKYSLPGDWGIKTKRKRETLTFFASPEKVTVESSIITILSDKLTKFPSISFSRCYRDNVPVEIPKEDKETGDLLCPNCEEARSKRKKGEGITLEDVAKKDKVEEKIGFIFLNLPEDLETHAKGKAEDLIKKFEYQNLIPPNTIQLHKKTGLFEYLQAVWDIQSFYEEIMKKIHILNGKSQHTAHQIFNFPTHSLYLLREDLYWQFLSFLLEERKKLSLDLSLKCILCRPKYPFWSLMMDSKYNPKIDIYYDICWEGGVIMFTAEDINAIRSLATKTGAEQVTKNQLTALVQTALRTNIHELMLEIDVRVNEGKLGYFKKAKGYQFAGELKNALHDLGASADTPEDRQKRAIFIKYITRLMK